MSTIDQQFVEFIVKSLVGNPDDVQVERTIDEKGVLLQLTVNGEDLGRVIGKRGSTAQSIRTLLRALGTKNDARYNLKIIDPTGGAPRRTDDRDDTAPSQDEPAEPASEAAPKEEPAEEPAEEAKEVEEPAKGDAEDESVEEEAGDSLADKTRKELAELDDLDI